MKHTVENKSSGESRTVKPPYDINMDTEGTDPVGHITKFKGVCTMEVEEHCTVLRSCPPTPPLSQHLEL